MWGIKGDMDQKNLVLHYQKVPQLWVASGAGTSGTPVFRSLRLV